MHKKYADQFEEHVKQEKRHIEHAGSDNDERYYDAEAEDEPGKKYEYYRNNSLAGVSTGWRSKSLIPLHRFLAMLRKNADDAVRIIELGKDTYEVELRELR